MKLYYAPGACSLAPHIILNETGLTFEIERVDLSTRTTKTGEDFLAINPKGYVPALKLESGEVLTEASITVQYLADQVPETGLIPVPGTMERYHVQEWLNFISAEVHKTLGALFNPAVSGDWKQHQLSTFANRADYLESRLKVAAYLAGDHFTVADAYLFTVLGWTGIHGIDLAPWPGIRNYIERIGSRPSVQAAMVAEGLLTSEAESLAKAS